MDTSHLLNPTIAHRHAGIVAGFMWQDEAAETRSGETISVDYTQIVGTLRTKVLENSVYVVHIDGTALTSFGYSYPVERDLKIFLIKKGDEIVPSSANATEEEVNEAIEYGREEAIKDYNELISFLDNGEGTTEARIKAEDEINEYNKMALANGEHFILSQQNKRYVLEIASQEEILAYQASLIPEVPEEDQDEE